MASYWLTFRLIMGGRGVEGDLVVEAESLTADVLRQAKATITQAFVTKNANVLMPEMSEPVFLACIPLAQ